MVFFRAFMSQGTGQNNSDPEKCQKGEEESPRIPLDHDPEAGQSPSHTDNITDRQPAFRPLFPGHHFQGYPQSPELEHPQDRTPEKSQPPNGYVKSHPILLVSTKI